MAQKVNALGISLNVPDVGRKNKGGKTNVVRSTKGAPARPKSFRERQR